MKNLNNNYSTFAKNKDAKEHSKKQDYKNYLINNIKLKMLLQKKIIINKCYMLAINNNFIIENNSNINFIFILF